MAQTASNVEAATDSEGWETIVEPFGETYSFETPGDVLTGTLTGKSQVETDDLNNPGEKRTQTVYEITDESGKKWSVWESFNIKKALDDMADGTQVRITFNGKVPSSKPGQTVKQFTVQTKK